MPRVSIGLPVYNGEKFLTQAIESLLNQTFDDFELIVCDNASTDGTENICRGYANADRRVTYYRNRENIGAGPNYNLVFGYATGEYFRWMAHDDVCASGYLEECVSVLDRDASVILCHSEVQLIGSQGQVMGNYDPGLRMVESIYQSKRFKDLIGLEHKCCDVFGLIRRDALKKTSLISNFVGGDRHLLAELSLMGRFYRVPKVLFYFREHPNKLNYNKTLHEWAEWWDPKLAGKVHMPYWCVLFGYYRSIGRVSIPVMERWKCYFALLALLYRNWRSFYWDLKVAAQKVTQDFALNK